MIKEKKPPWCGSMSFGQSEATTIPLVGRNALGSSGPHGTFTQQLYIKRTHTISKPFSNLALTHTFVFFCYYWTSTPAQKLIYADKPTPWLYQSPLLLMTSLHVIILITVRATPVDGPVKGKIELDTTRKEKKRQTEGKRWRLQMKELKRLGRSREGEKEEGKIECAGVRERQRQRAGRERKPDQLFILQSHWDVSAVSISELICLWVSGAWHHITLLPWDKQGL